jgi:hypothetical protein
MTDNFYKLKVTGGKIGEFDGIKFSGDDDAKSNEALVTSITTAISPTSGGRRRKRRTKVKSKKRANRRRRTRYQH